EHRFLEHVDEAAPADDVLADGCHGTETYTHSRRGSKAARPVTAGRGAAWREVHESRGRLFQEAWSTGVESSHAGAVHGSLRPPRSLRAADPDLGKLFLRRLVAGMDSGRPGRRSRR